MKKQVKFFATLFVMTLMLVSTSVTAEAATKTRKLTMFKSEKIEVSYYGMGRLKSVKSNKTKIVGAKKKSNKCSLTAKKTGKATVIANGTYGVFKYNITVKEPKISVSQPVSMGNNYYYVTAKNNGSGYFYSVNVLAHLYNSAGVELGTELLHFYVLGPKKTSSRDMYVSTYSYPDVDMSKTTYEIGWQRDVNYSFSDYTKKTTFTPIDNGNILAVNVKTSYNKSKGGVYAAFDVNFYDAAGNLIEVRSHSDYLWKKSRTSTDSIAKPNGTASYQIVNKRAYSQVYKSN